MKLTQTPLLLIVLIAGALSTLKAQDARYSQYYNTPLFINPSLTCFMDNNIRVSANYRSQWDFLADGGFETPSLSMDLKFGNLKEYGALMGFGLMVMDDKAANNKIKNQSVLLSGSFRFSGKKQRHSVGVGVQGGIFRRTFDNTLKFESDIFGGATEQFMDFQNTTPDFRLGVTLGSKLNRQLNTRLGASFLHINQITENFLLIPNRDQIEGVRGSTIPLNIILHGDATLKLKQDTARNSLYTHNYKFELTPSFLLMSQGSSRELTFGANLAYNINKGKQLNVGLHYRYNDAFIVSGGMSFTPNSDEAEVATWTVQVSYDLTASKLYAASKVRGGFELAFIYETQRAKSFGRTNPIDDFNNPLR